MAYVRKRPFAERFWEKVNKNGPVPLHRPKLGRCWVWIGSFRSDGYGQTRDEDQRRVSAHRAAYVMRHGPLPDGVHVLHKCDNKACVRWSHHFTGDQLDNMRDMIDKGRAAAGEQNGKAVLTQEQIDEVRRSYAAKEYTQTELAFIYNTVQPNISMIINEKTWPKKR